MNGKRRALRWFQERWEPRGYTAEYGASGHIKVYDPDGHYVTSLSASPRNPKSPEYEAERLLRRHHEGRTPNQNKENDR